MPTAGWQRSGIGCTRQGRPGRHRHSRASTSHRPRTAPIDALARNSVPAPRATVQSVAVGPAQPEAPSHSAWRAAHAAATVGGDRTWSRHHSRAAPTPVACGAGLGTLGDAPSSRRGPSSRSFRTPRRGGTLAQPPAAAAPSVRLLLESARRRTGLLEAAGALVNALARLGAACPAHRVHSDGRGPVHPPAHEGWHSPQSGWLDRSCWCTAADRRARRARTSRDFAPFHRAHRGAVALIGSRADAAGLWMALCAAREAVAGGVVGAGWHAATAAGPRSSDDGAAHRGRKPHRRKRTPPASLGQRRTRGRRARHRGRRQWRGNPWLRRCVPTRSGWSSAGRCAQQLQGQLAQLGGWIAIDALAHGAVESLRSALEREVRALVRREAFTMIREAPAAFARQRCRRASAVRVARRVAWPQTAWSAPVSSRRSVLARRLDALAGGVVKGADARGAVGRCDAAGTPLPIATYAAQRVTADAPHRGAIGRAGHCGVRPGRAQPRTCRAATGWSPYPVQPGLPRIPQRWRTWRTRRAPGPCTHRRTGRGTGRRSRAGRKHAWRTLCGATRQTRRSGTNCTCPVRVKQPPLDSVASAPVFPGRCRCWDPRAGAPRARRTARQRRCGGSEAAVHATPSSSAVLHAAHCVGSGPQPRRTQRGSPHLARYCTSGRRRNSHARVAPAHCHASVGLSSGVRRGSGRSASDGALRVAASHLPDPSA